jgi:hypothetical protein
MSSIEAKTDWNDITDESNWVEKEFNKVSIVKSDKPDQSDKLDKPDIKSVSKSVKKAEFKPIRPGKPDKPDRPDRPDRSDKPDKSDDKKKYFHHTPCWYLVHNFQCMQSECWFNHNPTIVKEHKLKRENKVCHLYRKCDKRCNKFHNMDELMELYTTVNSKLSAIESIVKT